MPIHGAAHSRLVLTFTDQEIKEDMLGTMLTEARILSRISIERNEHRGLHEDHRDLLTINESRPSEGLIH